MVLGGAPSRAHTRPRSPAEGAWGQQGRSRPGPMGGPPSQKSAPQGPSHCPPPRPGKQGALPWEAPPAVASPTSPAQRLPALPLPDPHKDLLCSAPCQEPEPSATASHGAAPPLLTPAASSTPASPQNPGSQGGGLPWGPGNVHTRPQHVPRKGRRQPGPGPRVGCRATCLLSSPKDTCPRSPRVPASLEYGQGPALGSSRPLPPGPTAQDGGGDREGAFQGGKGRSRCVPDAGR